MNLKQRLRVIEPDKANHFYYGSHIAAIAASIIAVICATLGRRWLALDVPLIVITLLCSALGAVAAARGAGMLGERMDKQTNDEAGTAVRAVSASDVMWTQRGALPVAIPLLVLAVTVALVGR